MAAPVGAAVLALLAGGELCGAWAGVFAGAVRALGEVAGGPWGHVRGRGGVVGPGRVAAGLRGATRGAWGPEPFQRWQDILPAHRFGP